MSIQVADQEMTRANLEAFNRIVSAFPPPPPLPAEVYRAAEKLGIPEDQVEERYYGKFRNLADFAKEVSWDLGPEYTFFRTSFRVLGRHCLDSGDYSHYRGHYFTN